MLVLIFTLFAPLQSILQVLRGQLHRNHVASCLFPATDRLNKNKIEMFFLLSIWSYKMLSSMKIDLNTSLLQPRCLSKCYCIKLESRYRLLLEYKNTFCHCRIWLFLISPPFHPLEKIIRQALCCSTSTEKLECAPRLHCHAMKKSN